MTPPPTLTASDSVFFEVPDLEHGPPIFVSGCNRGGTTILARILGAHPEVRNIGRGPFCEGQYIWRTRFRDWSRHRWAIGPWRRFLRRTAEDATPERIAYFRRAFCEATGGEGRLLEKTPSNAIRVPFIDRLYPDCRFVHVLRDGRHTSASLVARRVGLLYAPHQWVGAHRTALGDLKALPERRVVIVRYEELLRAPEETLGFIARRCGLSWRGSERDAVLDAVERLLEPPEDRWERLLGFQKGYILRVIRDLQQHLGYPVEP
jgi:hypothetical protein